MRVDLYTRESLERQRRTNRILSWVLLLLSALFLTVCILLCTRVTTLNAARMEKGTLIASGFIAGGAIMGVVSAILKFADVDLYLKDWAANYGEAVAIVPFLTIAAYMIYSSMKTEK